jgi:hypothetical protein
MAELHCTEVPGDADLDDNMFPTRYTSPYTCPAAAVFSSRSDVNDVANPIHSVFDFIRPRLHRYNLPYYNIPNYSSLGSTRWSKKAFSLQRRGSNITASPHPQDFSNVPKSPDSQSPQHGHLDH